MKWYSTNPLEKTMVQRINYLAKTDDTSFPLFQKGMSADATMITLYTICYMTYGGWQFDDSNYNDMPVAFADIKAGQNNYDIDTSMLTIKSVHMLQPNGDYAQIPTITNEVRNRLMPPNNADTGKVWAYKLIGNSIELIGMPDADVAQGIMVEFDRSVVFIADATSTSTVIGFPSHWHELICKGVASEYLGIRSKDNKKINSDWDDGLIAFEDYYRSRWEERTPAIITVKDTVRENI